MTRALVLGGGGITGIAWEAGVLAGLRERGWDTGHWDLVVGTSAGSIVGAKVLGDPDWEGWFAKQLAEATREDDGPIITMGGRVAAGFLRLGRLRRLGWLPRIWLAAFAAETFVRQRAGRRGRLRPLHRAPQPGPRRIQPAAPGLVRLGSFGLAARTASEQTFLEVIEQTLDPVADWPDRLTVTAIDVATGEAVAIDARSGVPFFVAVAASCSVPGLMPVVTIGDRRYMDGGMASQTHADLALGHDEVLVVAPLDLGRLGGEVQRLRDAGARVTVVSPSAEAAAALGRNVGLLDPARRARAAREGVADGRRAADAAGEAVRPPAGRVQLAGSEG
jgi:NTE family protein